MPDLRVRTVGTRVCEEEYQALEKLATARGQTLSEWTRQVVLAQLNPTTTANPHEETVTAEVLAFREILLNVLFRMVNGEKLTAQEMAKGDSLRGCRSKRFLNEQSMSYKKRFPRK